MNRLGLYLLAIVFILAGIVSCTRRYSEPLTGKTVDVADPDVKNGQILYSHYCYKCHPTGEAGLGPEILAKPGFARRFQTRHGLGAMPSFKKDEIDAYKFLPKGVADTVFTNDSTNVKHIKNEFIYSFFLRAKGNSLIKNELKIDVGIRHDFYNYAQYRILRDKTNFSEYPNTFQNISLLGNLGYRFSNRVDFNLDVQQIFQGENTGDFLYEAKSNLLLSKTAGRIVLGAYLQNKSPEEVYNRYEGNHYSWDKDFDRTKTANLSFNYINERFNIDASASYYLVSNYLYFIKSGTNIKNTYLINLQHIM